MTNVELFASSRTVEAERCQLGSRFIKCSFICSQVFLHSFPALDCFFGLILVCLTRSHVPGQFFSFSSLSAGSADILSMVWPMFEIGTPYFSSTSLGFLPSGSSLESCKEECGTSRPRFLILESFRLPFIPHWLLNIRSDPFLILAANWTFYFLH